MSTTADRGNAPASASPAGTDAGEAVTRMDTGALTEAVSGLDKRARAVY